MKRSVFFLLILISELSIACSCGEATVEDYVSSCDSIFVARLNEAHVAESQNPNSAIEGTFSQPLETFKGNPEFVDGLRTTLMGTSCEQKPKVGISYLVCGQYNMKASFSHCSKTSPAKMYGSSTHPIIEQLRKQPLNKEDRATEKSSEVSL